MTWFEEAKARLSLLFSVETLEFLRKGGRIGRAQAAIGGLLRVRPLLTLQDGEVAAYGRVRGASRVLPAFERYLLRAPGRGAAAGGSRCATPAARRRSESLQEMIARVRPAASVDHVLELGAVVGTHGGPGTVGHGGADRRMTLRGFAGAALDGPPPEPATAPRPSHLERAAARRQAAALGPRGDAAAAAAHGRRPARARALPLRGLPRRDAHRRPAAGRAGDDRLHGRLDPHAADPPPQPGDRRGPRARRLGAGAGGLVQPALPGQAADAGHGDLGARRAARVDRRRDRRRRATRCSARAPRRCTRTGWCRSTTAARRSPAGGCGRWSTALLGHAGDAPDALPADAAAAAQAAAAARCHAGRAPPGRAGRRPDGEGAGWRSTSCSCSRSGSSATAG